MHRPFILVAAALLWLSPIDAAAQGEPESGATAHPTVDVIQELTPDLTMEQLELLAAPLTADQLAEQAAAWQATLQEGMSHIASLKVAALEAEGAEAEA